MKVKSLSHVRLLATPWTAAYQAPPPMGFSRQEYWSGVPLRSPMRRLQPQIRPNICSFFKKDTLLRYDYHIQKLYSFNEYNSMFGNKYTLLNHRYNLCHKHVHYLQKFPPILFIDLLIYFCGGKEEQGQLTILLAKLYVSNMELLSIGSMLHITFLEIIHRV